MKRPLPEPLPPLPSATLPRLLPSEALAALLARRAAWAELLCFLGGGIFSVSAVERDGPWPTDAGRRLLLAGGTFVSMGGADGRALGCCGGAGATLLPASGGTDDSDWSPSEEHASRTVKGVGGERGANADADAELARFIRPAKASAAASSCATEGFLGREGTKAVYAYGLSRVLASTTRRGRGCIVTPMSRSLPGSVLAPPASRALLAEKSPHQALSGIAQVQGSHVDTHVLSSLSHSARSYQLLWVFRRGSSEGR